MDNKDDIERVPEMMASTSSPSSSEKTGSHRLVHCPKQAAEKGLKKFSAMKIVTAIFFILAIIVIIVLAVVIAHLRATSFYYCTTPACAHQAGAMLAVMNTSADPCEDFYNYACGRWSEAFPPTPDSDRYTFMDEAAYRIKKKIYRLLQEGNVEVADKNSTSVGKAISFYKSCMNIGQRELLGTAPLIDLLTQLGGWSLTKSPAINASWDFVTTVGEVGRLAISAPLTVSVVTNSLNSSEHVLEMSSYFHGQTDPNNTDPNYKEAFLSFFRSVASLVGDIGTTDQLNAKLEEVWALQRNMSLNRTTNYDTQNPQKMNNFLTVRQVQDTLIGSSFDFLRLLKVLFGYEFTGKEKIRVTDTPFVKYVATLVRTVDNEVWANYIMMAVVDNMAMQLTYRFQTLKGGSDTPRKFCFWLTTRFFPLQVSALYVDKRFNKENKKKVTNMVYEIKNAMRKLITTSTWMDSKTKKVALEKLRNLQTSVAYPDNLFNLTMLDQMYNSIHLNTSTFFKNYISILQADTKDLQRRLHKPVDRKEFMVIPIKANAYHDRNTMTIKILAGYVQSPFYDQQYFATSNLGAIGTTIGHEFSHAFDSRNQQYDQHGKFRKWWTPETRRRFKQRTQCFVDQYSRYKLYGVNNDGQRTVDNNMADNGGIQASLEAFKLYKQQNTYINGFLPGLLLTEKQLFFLSFAQTFCSYETKDSTKYSLQYKVHSPGPLRVLGTLSNQVEFAEAFRCPKESRYNPQKRCILW